MATQADFARVVGFPIFQTSASARISKRSWVTHWPQCKSRNGGSKRSRISRRTYKNPVPRGRGDIYARSPRACRSQCLDIDGQVPDGLAGIQQYNTPARAPTCPTAAAGLTRPPLVGTWVMAISLTRWSMARRSASSGELARCIIGMTSTTAPVFRCHLQKRDVIAGIFRHGSENAVARPEGTA